MGVEPTSSAWKADVLPLYDIRKCDSLLYASTSGTAPVCIPATCGAEHQKTEQAPSEALNTQSVKMVFNTTFSST